MYKCMLQTQSDLYIGKEMKSFSVPLCVSLFIPLDHFPSLRQFQFIIRKPDELAPPLRLSSPLHSAENCFNLHLSAANSISSVCLSVYCTASPCARSNKDNTSCYTPAGWFTPISTQTLGEKHLTVQAAFNK